VSVVYCHYCSKHIDTDFDAEHFIDGEEDNCIQKGLDCDNCKDYEEGCICNIEIEVAEALRKKKA